MSGGGGKGGSQTTKMEIPDWIAQPASRNLARAEAVQQLGYMPYSGPQIAAFNPTQQAAMQSNIGAAEAFGLLSPGSLQPLQGMPAPQTYAGGMQGYSSMPLYDQAVAELQARNPGQMAAYNELFSNPISYTAPEQPQIAV